MNRLWIKIVLICCSVLIFFGMMQQFQPKSTAEVSVFVKKNLAIPVGSIIMFLTFIIISTMFLRVKNSLPNNKILSGMLFSVSISGFWFIAMFESLFIYNESISLCLFLACVDSISIMILGILLGIFVKNDNIYKDKKSNYNLLKILIVAIVYVMGRIFSYFVIGVNSGMISMPVYNFLWVVGVGVTTGFFYMINSNDRKDSPLKMSLWFGLSFYGPIWFIYNSLNLLFVKHELSGIGRASIFDLYLKTGIDILFVTIGILFVEVIIASCKKPLINRV